MEDTEVMDEYKSHRNQDCQGSANVLFSSHGLLSDFWLSECEWLTVPTCPSKAMAPATHPLPCATRGCRTCIVFP